MNLLRPRDRPHLLGTSCESSTGHNAACRREWGSARIHGICSSWRRSLVTMSASASTDHGGWRRDRRVRRRPGGPWRV